MRRNTAIALLAASLVAFGACGNGTSSNDTTPTTAATDANPKQVTLLAYDAFTPADGIFDTFEKQTGAKVKVVTGGDSGTVISKAILTAGNPEGDVLWGVDNTTIARAKAANLLDSYEPVDTGDVCVNYSTSWYAKKKLAPPTSLDDLVKPAYKDQLVVQDPVNSSPGLAFLLATIQKYGNGWRDYWRALKANGVRIVADWTTAWTVEYAGGGNPGTRPMVVSYGSSPPAEIVYAADPKNPPSRPDSAIIEATCFRQTEYVGVLRGAKNPNNARKLVDHLLGTAFQESMPLTLFVFPVNTDAKLPDVFTTWAVKAASPFTASPTQEELTAWLDDWRAIAL